MKTIKQIRRAITSFFVPDLENRIKKAAALRSYICNVTAGGVALAYNSNGERVRGYMERSTARDNRHPLEKKYHNF